MTLFGVSPDEVEAIRTDLVNTQQELREEKADNTRNLQTLEANRGTITDLREANRRLTAAGPIAVYAAAQLEAAEKSGEIQISAYETAQQVVTQRWRDQVVASLADEILDATVADEELQFTKEDLDQTRAELDEIFEHDGTYDAERQSVRDNKKKQIGTELKTAARTAEEAHLAEPEEHNRLVAEAKKELMDQGLLEELVAEERRSRQAVIKAQAKEEILAEAQTQAEADGPAALEKAKKEYRESYDGKNKIANVKQAVIKKWTNPAAEKVLEETKDAELAEQIERNLTLSKEKLDRANLHLSLLDHFTNGGIDTTEILAGSEVQVLLGSKKMESKEGDYDYSSQTRPQIKIQPVERVLTLSALGDGQFIVDKDSFSDSASPVEQENAIQNGTVIVLGRNKSVNGAVDLHPFIKQGVKVYFDDDTTDGPGSFKSAYFDAQCVGINGVYTKTKADIFRLPNGSTIERKDKK